MFLDFGVIKYSLMTDKNSISFYLLLISFIISCLIIILHVFVNFVILMMKFTNKSRDNKHKFEKLF